LTCLKEFDTLIIKSKLENAFNVISVYVMPQ